VTVMRKGIPDALLAHYATGAVTVTDILRLRTRTGELFALTDLDENVTYDPAAVDPYNTGDDWGPLVHKATGGGYSMSRLEAAENLSVDNAEFTILPGFESITPQQLLAGILDGADVRVYRVNYMDLSMGHECIAVGRLGNSRVSQHHGFLEYLSLTALLKQPEADLHTVDCRHIFGGPKCPKAFTWVEGTVTAVDADDPHRIFADSGLVADDDAFVPGVMEWVTGNNAGRDMDVEQNTGGTFALRLGLGYAAQIGDTFRVRMDCSKLWGDAVKGCLFHWGEARFEYFGGYPHARVGDRAMVPGAIINEA
jgi:uncharacterized phage protein (TIGR02218 family)